MVQKANYDLIQAFPTGIFTYGFTRDNILGNESARKALLQGRTNGIKVFSSYNLNEVRVLATYVNNGRLTCLRTGSNLRPW